MKVGIIGCGEIAKHHLPHILKQTTPDQIGLMDLDVNIAKETANRYGIEFVFSDFISMKNELEPDIIHILTPPMAHAKSAIEAMEAGCHVLVEKPMALSIGDSADMITAAQLNGVELCVDHNFLFSPGIREAERLIQSGQIGKLIHLEAHYHFDLARMPGYALQAHWAYRLPGGLISDHIPHPASVLLHFMDEPVRVWAVNKCNGILMDGQSDELRALIEGDSVTGFLSISLGTRPDSFTVDLYGTEMTIHVNISNMTIIVRRNRKISKKIMRVVDGLEQTIQLFSSTLINSLKVGSGKLRPPGDVGLVINEFYKNIQNGTKSPINGEEGKKVVVLMNEIWKQLN
jgi:predicted dehydrogenase